MSTANERGFTLAEILVAISVLSFAIISVYSAFSTMVLLTYNISARFTAAYLAHEGLEIVRNLRDNNFIALAAWDSGITAGPCSEGCQVSYKTNSAAQIAAYNGAYLGLNDDGFYSYDEGAAATRFQRKVTISPVADNSQALNVSATVYWEYNGQPFNLTIEEYLYDWY